MHETEKQIADMRAHYLALLRYCDENLGRVLDAMDAHDMWRDTMLIVNTDHGVPARQHDWWGKNDMPDFNEIAHTPLYVWNPRFPQAAGQSRNSLVQTIDLPATLLDFFGLSRPADMQGRPLSPVLADDTPIRSCGLFGIFGARQFMLWQTDIPEIVDYGEDYLRVVSILSFGVFGQIALSACCRPRAGPSTP